MWFPIRPPTYLIDYWLFNKIHVFLWFKFLTQYGENNNVLVTKINLDGTFDESYGTDEQHLTTYLPSGITLLDVNKTITDEIIITGYKTSLSPPEYTQNITLSKLDAQGNLDSSFGNEGVITLTYDNETYNPYYAFYKNQRVYILFNDTFGDAYITKYETDTMVTTLILAPMDN